MATRCGLYNQGSSGWTSMTMRNGDLQEEDVWGVVLKQTKDCDSKFNTTKSFKVPSVLTRPIPTASRMIPRPKSKEPENVQQHSAPVNVPDWSKVYGKSSSNGNSSSWLDTDANDDGYGFEGNGFQSEEEEDDGNEGNFVPPHEWIARRQVSSLSVCEGAGRTLKGRDLSRVRNTVLTRTGFLESQ